MGTQTVIYKGDGFIGGTDRGPSPAYIPTFGRPIVWKPIYYTEFV